MKSMKWTVFLSLGIGVMLASGAGCSDAASSASGGTDSGEPLDEGDAEWEKPPIDPPGGEGEGGDGPGDGGDDGGGGDPGGDDGATGGGDTATGTGTGGGYPCEDYTGVCDEHTNACEPPPDYTGAPPPCCDDPNCMCDGNAMCDELPCVAEGVCDCKCHPGHDPDCAPGACDETGTGSGTGTGTDTGTGSGHVARAECPDTHDPVVLYMSNDDSNSQGSPAVARRTINDGGIVWPNDVRIYEFLNYYDLSYQNPSDVPAEVGIQMRRTNADTGEFTLLLFAQGRQISSAARRPINLVFSLDTSGSMSGEPMDLLKDTMRAVAGSLRAGDVVSIVAWNDQQEVLLETHSVAGADDQVLLDAINGLEPGGSTNLYAGLDLAYEIARAGFSEDRINRVMMISDGGANVGITESELIGQNADDKDGEGIYMIGVGVAGGSYHDDLMDAVTDAGKGAYVFIDSPAEAEHMFGERFLANVEVAAREVRMELTMPWYFAIKEFHGEEYSEDPEEVEPQHLAPNDAMSYHQVIEVCDPVHVYTGHKVKARASYKDPITREEMESAVEIPIGELVTSDATQLHKGDVVVAYAQALIVIGDLMSNARQADALEVAQNMVAWLEQAAMDLGDPEVSDIASHMSVYATTLEGP